jgi:hypothetical protein
MGELNGRMEWENGMKKKEKEKEKRNKSKTNRKKRLYKRHLGPWMMRGQHLDGQTACAPWAISGCTRGFDRWLEFESTD